VIYLAEADEELVVKALAYLATCGDAAEREKIGKLLDKMGSSWMQPFWRYLTEARSVIHRQAEEQATQMMNRYIQAPTRWRDADSFWPDLFYLPEHVPRPKIVPKPLKIESIRKRRIRT